MKRPQNSKKVKEEIIHDVEDSDHSSSSKKSSKQEDQIKCELCSTICTSISQLQSHTINEHIPDRKPSTNSAPSTQRVACQQCGDTFDTFAQFAIHMKSHIGSPSSPIFFCPICPMGAPFRDKKSQIEHLTTQHLQIQMNQFICSVCDSCFASTQAFAHHFTETHHKIMCIACDFVTDNEKAFKDHSKVHTRQIVMYGCALCASSYTNQQSLITHVQLAHDQDSYYPPSLPIATTNSKPAPKPRTLICSVCDETVLGEDGLDEHRLRKHCKIRYADKCADCQELLLNETTFVEHCIRHAKDHAHHCPVCRQSLRSDAQIHAHCSYHMPPMVQKTSDDFTSSTSSSPNGLAGMAFVCPICGEKLEDAFALIEHSKHHI
ncbi:hypothetical protein GCK72_011909 [Caenorhabditis remanei]|uniref:C2H2-type domain-containing protein n=1 Tax=Caenorhabditis remanei TaxID=31234 RepID=A0A6A5HB86_CAERE|nr:hypothetical protein GCK72_011909 [Caenorhabditis remanei]KAF1763642.1 hypothetical protein GCK72_011909 [Caenorhabditis remanei]